VHIFCLPDGTVISPKGRGYVSFFFQNATHHSLIWWQGLKSWQRRASPLPPHLLALTGMTNRVRASSADQQHSGRQATSNRSDMAEGKQRETKPLVQKVPKNSNKHKSQLLTGRHSKNTAHLHRWPWGTPMTGGDKQPDSIYLSFLLPQSLLRRAAGCKLLNYDAWCPITNKQSIISDTGEREQRTEFVMNP